MKPTAIIEAPSVVTRKAGSSAWIISDDKSMKRLTKPSAQIPRGMRRRPASRPTVVSLILSSSPPAQPPGLGQSPIKLAQFSE
jgi:hypothetical protein